MKYKKVIELTQKYLQKQFEFPVRIPPRGGGACITSNFIQQYQYCRLILGLFLFLCLHARNNNCVRITIKYRYRTQLNTLLIEYNKQSNER